MKPVIVDSEAEAEFRAAIEYYDEQRQGLGEEFESEVEQCINRIAQTPQAFSPYGSEGLRKCVVNRFPYTIFYLELDNRIWIAAIAHQRRRPGYWSNRLPE